jgi:hypothetical protein
MAFHEGTVNVFMISGWRMVALLAGSAVEQAFLLGHRLELALLA